MKAAKPGKPRKRAVPRLPVKDVDLKAQRKSARSFVKVCGQCGRVLSGPDKNKVLRDAAHTSVYHGKPISHGLCPSCATKPGREHRKRKGL